VKPFVFRAQIVLELRAREAERALQALALATSRVQLASADVDRAVTALAAACDQAGRGPGVAADLALAAWYRNWIERLRRELEASRRDLAARELEAHDARTRATIARRRVRALERLRDRAWAAHREAERLEAQRELDELGTRQHANRQREGHLER
jgi:flagellar export protein FliJ